MKLQNRGFVYLKSAATLFRSMTLVFANDAEARSQL